MPEHELQRPRAPSEGLGATKWEEKAPSFHGSLKENGNAESKELSIPD